MPSSPFFSTKGIDLTSAAALTLGSDGDAFHVTGATTITSISVRPAGFEITLIFNGALTVTHNATSLILQGGVNLTTVAGDVIKFVSEGSGNWRESSRLAAGSSIPAQWARGSIAAFLVENDGSNPNTDILINAGKCRDLAYSWAFGVDTGGTLLTSLIAYWKLDEASGIRKDSYGWADMAATRSAPTSVAGKQGAAASFASASSQFLQVPASTPLQLGNISFSVSVWVKLTDKSANYGIISQSDNTGAGQQFKLRYMTSQDRFNFRWWTDGASTSVSVDANNLGSPSANTWYHIVCYHNASNNTIGIIVNNGTADTTAATGGNSTSAAWGIGTDDVLNVGLPLNGVVDEATAWRKVLAAQEITDLYNSGAGNTLTETLSDSTNLTGLTLIKRLTSAWAVGNNGGLLDTGSVTTNTTYHIFAINRPDTGVTDYIASLNPKKPTLPANYTTYRRIRSIRLDGSSNIYKETQDGNRVIFAATIEDFNVTNPGTSAVARTLSLPMGVRVDAIMHIYASVPTAGNRLYISDMNANDENAGGGGTAPEGSITGSSAGQFGAPEVVRATKSAQVRTRIDGSDGSTIIRGSTHGYVDPDLVGAGR